MYVQAPIKWEPVDVTPRLKDGKTVIADETIESIERNKVALKGPLAVRIMNFQSGRLILTGIDTNWKGSRFSQPYSSPYL